MIEASILLIEKYDALRKALRNWLEAVSPMYCVSEATSLTEAISIGQREEMHVILMNGASPAIGEIEATREIKAAFPNIALIVLTPRECEVFHETILEAGAMACVPTWEITDKLPDILTGLLEEEPANKLGTGNVAPNTLDAGVRTSMQ